LWWRCWWWCFAGPRDEEGDDDREDRGEEVVDVDADDVDAGVGV
jgi:hypothetical protein